MVSWIQSILTWLAGLLPNLNLTAFLPQVLATIQQAIMSIVSALIAHLVATVTPAAPAVQVPA